MYSIKPIIDPSEQLDGILAASMYQLPAGSASVISCVSVTPDEAISRATFDAVAARQATVLRQLEDIKNKLSCMKSVLDNSTTASSAPASAVAAAAVPKKTGAKRLEPGPQGAPHAVVRELHRQRFGATADKPVTLANLSDIVINANPATYLPYALRVIKSLWQDRIEVRVRTYTHSSIVRLPEQAVHFNALIQQQAAPTPAALPVLDVTLIWKDCAHPALICSAAAFQPIVGEPNILRYLYRCGPAELLWPDYPIADHFVPDSCLDLVHALTVVAGHSAKERKPLWRALQALLGEARHFGGTVICAADVALAGAVRQFGVLGNEDVVPASLVAVWKDVEELAEHGLVA